MKISKFNFLKLLAKHFSIKLGVSNPSEAELNMLATSLVPALSPYIAKMKQSGIMDSNEEINIDTLDSTITKFFQTVPILNFPFGNQTLTITAKDVELFMKELRQRGTIDEVIYLPCH